MQQRRLRLGDILDDYCPRERRVTNHAVVAMIDDQVKQTRCSTCDADHEYKEARVPASRRRKDTGEPVLSEPLGAADAGDLSETEPLADAIAVAEAVAVDDDPPDVIDDDGPVHRPLIRATLPRPEGQLPEWKEPEFTSRLPGRDGNRSGGGGGQGQGQRPNGRNRRPMRAAGGQNGAGPSRFGGARPAGPRHGGGQGQPQRQNNNRPGGPQGGPRGAGGPSDQRGPGRKRGR